MAPPVVILLLFCLLPALGRTGKLRYGPLPRASARPAGVDHELDCDLKTLAWDYAMKLLPRQGAFKSAYDALELENCKSSYVRKPNHYEVTPFSHSVSLSADSLDVYVDANKGNDSNPGTLTEPVKTVAQAVKLSRLNRQDQQQVVIYLRDGTYYLSQTIELGAEDSNTVVAGYPGETATVSGGREYQFDWIKIVDEMGPVVQWVDAMNGTVTDGGESDGSAWFYGKVDNVSACQTACTKNDSCFAFTWHDPTTETFANTCYFRIDGLWAPAYEQKGYYSGKKLKLYAADLTSQTPTPFNTLFINGRRSIRARYPDGNPETMGLHTFPTGYVSNAYRWLPVKDMPAAEEIHIESPTRDGTHFPQFEIGIGGPVAVFDPPESYWGLKYPTGGGGATYTITTGMIYSTDEEISHRDWSNPTTGVVHTFHCGHWGNWQFQVASRDKEEQTIYFGSGGFQEARGCKQGAEWYVENIKEELDAPNEWFYDEKNQVLYYFPNSSSLPESGIGTLLEQLFTVKGTPDAPVTQFTFTNLTFAHTASTFLKKYEVPSAGDWAIHRGGALFVEGIDGLLVQNCLFFSPGGNGLFLSGYVRNAVVEGNEFVYCGDSAIAAVGTADLIDGTLGHQPRGTQILNNLVHEIGIWGKETSAYFQSLACQTTLSGNVFFNGPRAGINFNDGFGGGNLVERNVVFNMVRETGDHGPFNSWDRQPYLTAVRNGSASLTPAQNNITLNFLINNYHSTWPLDHDDGSCYYYDTYNYLVYGGYKNFLGHTKVVKYNYYIYPDVDTSPTGDKLGSFFQEPFCANSDGASTGSLPSGWGEVWANNTCIIGNPNIYRFSGCTTKGSNTGLIPLTANNTFFAPSADIYILCDNVKLSLAEFQAMGYDLGSQVHNLVGDATIIDWGRDLLGLN